MADTCVYDTWAGLRDALSRPGAGWCGAGSGVEGGGLKGAKLGCGGA